MLCLLGDAIWSLLTEDTVCAVPLSISLYLFLSLSLYLSLSLSLSLSLLLSLSLSLSPSPRHSLSQVSCADEPFAKKGKDLTQENPMAMKW